MILKMILNYYELESKSDVKLCMNLMILRDKTRDY